MGPCHLDQITVWNLKSLQPTGSSDNIVTQHYCVGSVCGPQVQNQESNLPSGCISEFPFSKFKSFESKYLLDVPPFQVPLVPFNSEKLPATGKWWQVKEN
jgi:hypothetical protein